MKDRTWLLIGGSVLGAVALWRLTMSSPRDRLLKIASAEVGKTDPLAYWQDVTDPTNAVNSVRGRLAWCGVFALSMLKRAGIVRPDVQWTYGLGFISPLGLPRTSSPEPGDIAYIDQPYQHHAIVERVNQDGSVTTIDGNQPNVARRTRPRSSFSAFYSISKLIG